MISLPVVRFFWTLLASVPLLCGLNGLQQSHAQPRWEFPDLQSSMSIRDGRSGQILTWEAMIQHLAKSDVVFLGESHDDDTTHQLQLAVYQSMLEQRQGKVVLAMEMFDRDVQPYINAYLEGKIDEADFLKRARPWGNYHEAYRPLVEQARTEGKPVIASNFPRPLRVRLMQAGAEGLDALGDDRHLAPQLLFPNSAMYWKRTDNATRGHAAFMAPATSDEERLMSTQSLWDNAMGEACVQAIDEFPQHQVIHLNGGFHSQFWDGTVSQVRQRRPELSLKTVAIHSVVNPQSAEPIGAPVADFLVFVESRAKNLRDGQRHVVVHNQLPYSLYVPDWASAARPAPLLIWLGDDGLMPLEGLELWRLILGDQMAIAVPRPLHLQQERDLSIGGRWFWPDQFPEDTATTIAAVERIWQYTLNRFPIDSQRVVLAGEGSGGTMVVATALLTSKIDLIAIANMPRHYAKIKDFPLPLLENWGDQSPPRRKLIVIGGPEQENWWQEELTAYQSIGIEAAWFSRSDDPWENDLVFRHQIQSALGFDPKPKFETQSNPATRKLLIAKSSSTREYHWLRMLAERERASDLHVTVVSKDRAVPYAETDLMGAVADPEPDRLTETAIPLCPGPFGGTTVLVLDDQQSTRSLPTWLQLEAADPLNKRSRFHRLRIANLKEGEQHLENVLQKLKGENRKNVLIVPAKFYAGGQLMQELEAIADSLVDQMTLHWQPGLGANY